MTRFNRRSPWFVALLLFATFSLIAGACSDSASDTEAYANVAQGSDTTAPAGLTTTTFANDAPQAYRAGGPLSGTTDNSGEFVASTSIGTDGIAAPVVFQTPDFGRDIIFTAEISVAVTDVAVAGDKATREIELLGGT